MLILALSGRRPSADAAAYHGTYRKTQIQDRQREAARLHKILGGHGIKLGCVATDILGKSGRAMRDARVSDATDLNALVETAETV